MVIVREHVTQPARERVQKTVIQHVQDTVLGHVLVHVGMRVKVVVKIWLGFNTEHLIN